MGYFTTNGYSSWYVKESSSGPVAFPSTTVSPGVFSLMSAAEIVAPFRDRSPVLPTRSSFATPENLPADVT